VKATAALHPAVYYPVYLRAARGPPEVKPPARDLPQCSRLKGDNSEPICSGYGLIWDSGRALKHNLAINQIKHILIHK